MKKMSDMKLIVMKQVKYSNYENSTRILHKQKTY